MTTPRPILSLAAVAALCLATAYARADAPLNTLYAFPNDQLSPNGYARGAAPEGDMVQGADGNFYGTTAFGGSSICNDGFVVGCGTIFKLTPGGTQTSLYSFTYDSTTQAAANGGWPVAGLVQGPDGYFYGVTSSFGTNTAICNATGGCGTVFKISPAGKFQMLHSFAGVSGSCTATDGGNPRGRLLLARDGNFYGTTYWGGCFQGGTIFRISSGGKYQLLHIFQGANNTPDGANPASALIQGADGFFYGTTQFGGAFGAGTVFRMTSAGAVTILHSFVHSAATGAAPGGSEPVGSLVQASDGNLYGTTSLDGAGSAGTLFRITTKGAFTSLYDFTLNATYTGTSPRASLMQATDGNLYGTTWRGGVDDFGTVFRATLAGAVAEAAVYTGNNGWNPVAGVLQAADGTLIGDAPGMGSGNGGTIVQANLGLQAPPPALGQFSPSSGAAGSKVTLTGAHFVGATAVAFNGTPASFQIMSVTSIRATVPAGATSGPISITSPAGTSTAKSAFTVP